MLPSAAPNFSALDQHGKTIDLRDLQGKKIVLYFYPKDSTSGCTTEALDFQASLDDFRKLNSVILGVSKDSLKSHQNFANKQGLTFSLLVDKDTKICQAYECWVKKSMYGREYMGTERSTFIIDENGNIIKEWRKVKVKDHVQAVLNFIRQHDAS